MQGTDAMDTFAHTPELRAAIAAGRAECALYFWRTIFGVFRR
jgi:hypothetical protein